MIIALMLGSMVLGIAGIAVAYGMGWPKPKRRK